MLAGRVRGDLVRSGPDVELGMPNSRGINRTAISGKVAAAASKMRRVARPQLPPVRNWMNTMPMEPSAKPEPEDVASSRREEAVGCPRTTPHGRRATEANHSAADESTHVNAAGPLVMVLLQLRRRFGGAGQPSSRAG